ncbi:hypothetical protein V6N12_073928 [Hibiscus sabdariffa]|uniref:Putative plant transposon protein domain-containing protein n=1 Tax=Hibiscus sabdariffa TaxID=183260 RepID=A0ABR2AX88_9ROSI
MANTNFSARYSMIAAKNRWEEQGFYFDDSQPNYGLEQFVYNRLNELGWRVPANAATINAILGLPDIEPSFYAMLGGFEEEDFELIKDYLCEEGTAWNTTGRNPHLVSRLSLRPEAKLWNTFVKRNIMPTSQNQTVDRTRLLLIHMIMTGYQVNVGEILAKELAAACANDKGIQAFPCLISALCRRAAVPTSQGDKFQPEKTGWTRATYMRKMDVADATPLNMAKPIPPASPILTAAAPIDEVGPSAPATQVEPQHTQPASPPIVPVSSHATTTSPATTPAARERSRESTPDTPLGSTPISSPSPPAPAQSEEATPPFHILQLRSQLQRIEARKIQFQEETKVFNQSLVKFLCFQFPAAATFFAQPSSAPPQHNVSAAAQPSANTSAKAGATEEIHFSSDDENDVFDWQSPKDHLQPIGPTPSRPTITVPILSAAPTPTTSTIADRSTPDSPIQRKGKAKAGRSFGRDIPSSPNEEAEQRLAKRRRRYDVITTESNDDDSSAKLPVPQPEKSADPSLSDTF